METTLEYFKKQQSSALELLDKLTIFLQQGEKIGVQIDPSLRRKLDEAIGCVTGDKLKVALIGGFSEGKTTIAAAWMGRLVKNLRQPHILLLH